MRDIKTCYPKLIKNEILDSGTCYPKLIKNEMLDMEMCYPKFTKKEMYRMTLGRVTPSYSKKKRTEWYWVVLPQVNQKWNILNDIGTCSPKLIKNDIHDIGSCYPKLIKNGTYDRIFHCYPMKSHGHAWDVLPLEKIRDKIWLPHDKSRDKYAWTEKMWVWLVRDWGNSTGTHDKYDHDIYAEICY